MLRRLKKTLSESLPLSLYLRFKFPVEDRLFRGGLVKEGGGEKSSVLFFTTQKTASSSINKLFKYLNLVSLKMNLVDVSYYSYVMSPDPEFKTLELFKSKIFREKGFVYAPLRDYVEPDNYQDYTVLFFLRDPRDVLVSNYFSMKYSHGEPRNKERRKNFLEVRRGLDEIDIDSFVLRQAAFYKKKYEDYLMSMKRFDGYVLLRYEDMVMNSAVWVEQLLSALSIPMEDQVVDGVFKILGLDEVPLAEDKSKHVRSKYPGDFKRKLKSSTVEKLNSEFLDVLDHLGYDV